MKKLLLADSDPANSVVLQTALAGEGYRVTAVHNLDDWNQVVYAKSFNLIIMDETFLSISKHLFDLSKEAFRAFENTPIIVMTEYPELVEKRFRFPKKARFLLKPFHADEMFSMARQIFFDGAVALA